MTRCDGAIRVFAGWCTGYAKDIGFLGYFQELVLVRTKLYMQLVAVSCHGCPRSGWRSVGHCTPGVARFVIPEKLPQTGSPQTCAVFPGAVLLLEISCDAGESG